MPPAALYHPALFYLITIFIALSLTPLAAYFSKRQRMEKVQVSLIIIGLCVPAITAIAMIYASQNTLLIQDFWDRLFLFKISLLYLGMILLLLPSTVLLATGISLLFGYSTEQFSISDEFLVMKRGIIIGIAIPLLLAPVLEELGWRGYGVDSLRAYYNLFTTSMLFGLLWSLWHLPAFFTKGNYHNQLWHLGTPYVLNFFVSIFAVSILMNWVYYKTGRSIPAAILFHSVLNFSFTFFKTQPFTRCIVTALLCVVVIMIIGCDPAFFFT
ncbi:MAG: CPBP family intramembrane metalloprotease [Chlamydiales bacterium]|nr:CPBP family intramembrane metalloprotease [Chlamydiales bacterium]